MKHEIFRDFEIQRDHQILARRPDPVLRNPQNRTYPPMGFVVRQSENR